MKLLHFISDEPDSGEYVVILADAVPKKEYKEYQRVGFHLDSITGMDDNDMLPCQTELHP